MITGWWCELLAESAENHGRTVFWCLEMTKLMKSTIQAALGSAALALMCGPLQADRFDVDPDAKPKGEEAANPDAEAKAAADKAAQEAALKAAAEARIKEGVQISELGMMRVFLVLNRDAARQEDQIHQLLSDYDFRLFPTRNYLELQARFDSTMAKEEGHKRQADLVYYTKVETKQKAAFGEFVSFEANVTAQLYNILTGELLATHSSRVAGARSTDEEKAKRSAIEKGVDQAVKKVVEKSLAKVQKVLVHEVQFTGIKDEREALKILKTAQKLEGVSYARQMWFDQNTGSLGLELIGSPRTEKSWKAWVESIAAGDVPVEDIKVVPNTKLREKYEDWFAE